MLTHQAVQTAKPKKNAWFLWDGPNGLPGFGLRIQPSGTKAFVIQFRDARGKHRRVSVGRPSELGLKEARERARAVLAEERDGLPSSGAGAEPNTPKAAGQRKAKKGITVEALCARFEDEYVVERIALGRMTNGTALNYRSLSRRLVAAIGHAPAASVTRVEARAVVKGMTGAARNKLLQYASSLFSWAEREGLVPHWFENPTHGVERAAEQPRDRILSSDELAVLEQALASLEEEQRTQVAAIRVLMLSAWRIGEVAGLRWEDLDLDNGVGRIDGKTGPRTLTLAPRVVDVLRGLEDDRKGPYVFATRANTRPTEKAIRRVFYLAAEAAGLENIRPHDLRRTGLTAGARAGLSEHQLMAVSGHRSPRMLSRYVRQAGLDAQAAVGAVADAIAGHALA